MESFFLKKGLQELDIDYTFNLICGIVIRIFLQHVIKMVQKYKEPYPVTFLSLFNPYHDQVNTILPNLLKHPRWLHL